MQEKNQVSGCNIWNIMTVQMFEHLYSRNSYFAALGGNFEIKGLGAESFEMNFKHVFKFSREIYCLTSRAGFYNLIS